MPVANANADTNSQAEVENLISVLSNLPADMNTRLERVTRAWIGRPYLLHGPLGEGSEGKYDQDPLFRLDGFDCTTFIETAYAISQARDFADFMNRLTHVRYLNGEASFTSRNHFVELDWNPHNIDAGFFMDRTQAIGDESDRGIATQVFSKRNWYASLPLSALKLPGASPELLQSRLSELHAEGAHYADVSSQLLYLKKTSLLKLRDQLPLPSILNIVRVFPGSSRQNNVIAVTHQVLLIAVNGQLRVRAASSRASVMRVIDVPYETYVETLIASASTLGVNLLQVLPTPL